MSIANKQLMHAAGYSQLVSNTVVQMGSLPLPTTVGEHFVVHFESSRPRNVSLGYKCAHDSVE